MATKVLGFIELVWTCDSCGTQNPGPIKSCTACGAPQPQNVKFEKVDEKTFDFIKDAALIRQAESGADKHCPYCGTRNLAEAATCVKCGSDLTVGAPTREHGTILEQRDQPAPAKKSSRGLFIFLAILIVICVGIGIFMSKANKTTSVVTGTVKETTWQRSVQLMGYRSVTDSDWKDLIPSDAIVGSCELRYRYDSPTYVDNSKEVCGEPYTVDTGTGIGRVQQDCVYQVYEDHCAYQKMDWVLLDTVSTKGTDLNAYWPEVTLTSNERLENQTERYVIVFTADGKDFVMTTSDYNIYGMASPGSQWKLELNTFGNVREAVPIK